MRYSNNNSEKISLFAYSYLKNPSNLKKIIGRTAKAEEHHLDGYDTTENAKGETVIKSSQGSTVRGVKYFLSLKEMNKLKEKMSPYKKTQVGNSPETYGKLITFMGKGGKTKSKGKICSKGKAWAMRKYGKWSAYAAMGASRKCKDPGYAKEHGGILGMSGGGQLAAWRKEKWTKSDGSPCGNAKAQKNPSRCKPASKWYSMTPSEKRADNAKKKAGGKKGKQFVSATKKGKVSKSYTKRQKGGVLNNPFIPAGKLHSQVNGISSASVGIQLTKHGIPVISRICNDAGQCKNEQVAEIERSEIIIPEKQMKLIEKKIKAINSKETETRLKSLGKYAKRILARTEDETDEFSKLISKIV